MCLKSQKLGGQGKRTLSVSQPKLYSKTVSINKQNIILVIAFWGLRKTSELLWGVHFIVDAPQASYCPPLARVGIADFKVSKVTRSGTLSLWASQASRENLWSHEVSGMFHIHSIHRPNSNWPQRSRTGGQSIKHLTLFMHVKNSKPQ